MRSWWLISLVSMACGGVSSPIGDAGPDGAGDGGGGVDAAPPGEYRSGSRLRARILVTADGQRDFQGFVDSQLGAGCWFSRAADGEERCLPSEAGSGGWYFLDAACSADQAVAAQWGDCPPGPPTTIHVSDSSTCPPVTRVHRTGAAVVPTMLYFRDPFDGMCKVQTPSADAVYYRVGTEIPATDYVSAVRRRDGSGRLQRDVLEGEDGSRMLTWSLTDTQRGEACYFDHAIDSELRCLPSQSLYDNGYFGDAGCTQPLAVHYPSACAESGDYVTRYERSSCPTRKQIFQLGAQQTPAAVYYSYEPTMCLASGLAAPYTFYGIGAEVNAVSFERADVIVAPGSERLREKLYVTADGLRLAVGWHDSQRDQPCYFSRAVDDSFRCLSFDAFVSTDLFSDMGCLTPFRAGQVYTGWCGTESAPATLVEQLDRCPIAYRVYQAGDAFTPPPLYQRLSDGQCLAFTATNYAWYQVGAEIPPSDLVKGTILTE
jgi:hypothetical protein